MKETINVYAVYYKEYWGDEEVIYWYCWADKQWTLKPIDKYTMNSRKAERVSENRDASKYRGCTTIVTREIALL